MPSTIDALKKTFREGARVEAIAACEAGLARDSGQAELKRLCATMHAMVGNHARALELLLQLRDPTRESEDLLFDIATCERALKNFQGAAEYFTRFTEKFPQAADGWAGLAESQFQLRAYDDGLRCAARALERDPASVPAWTVRGNCQGALQRLDDALASFGRAIALAPGFARLRVLRGETFEALGRLPEAAADYRAALEIEPGDDATLKKATVCMLESGHGEAAIALCHAVLERRPDSLTARLGAEWIMSQLVPLWHVPMMNEVERNQAFHDGLASAVTPDTTVFEIGTGSGLLAMMAARLGAPRVTTCEAVDLIAQTAKKIVARNGFADRVTVLAKPSHAVQVGRDLPEPADILVHEVFSSELLGEHVLPAIEDAKRRLLKPGGLVLPACASIMVALVGGDALGKNVHVGESFGFDLGGFNAIHPKRRPLYREDLQPLMMSADTEAFRFDFQNQDAFPAEQKTISITATESGLCYGLIQWIRIELGEAARFENHPSRPRPVSNWQHTVYGFDAPVQVEAGTVLAVHAMHDRSRPWFGLSGR
ncbi:MAG TPA: tetratricopeptide repeat protein [Ramlibacter sp.]|jgi:tetratricopeptide (TPR) repeat protein